MAGNPWHVESIQAFYWLKCPECPFDTKEENHFEIHASKNHPLSSVYFGQKHQNEHETNSAMIKEEPIIDTNLEENLEVENSSLNSEYQEVSLAKNSEYQQSSLFKVSSLENEVNISDQPNFGRTTVKQEHIEITETVLNEDPLNISHDNFSVPEKKNVVITDPNVENIVVNNEDNVVNAIIGVDIKHIEPPEDPFHVCSMCDYKTLSLSKFSLHLKTQYHCNHCGEIFHGMHGKRNYKRHVINHEKPAKPESYKCSECTKTFPLKANLKRHIKCVHNSLKKPKKTYNCTMCNKCFSYPSLINRHIKLVHESSTNCLICDKNFSFPSQLKNHMAKKHTSMSKKIDYAINFDTLPIQIPEVVGYQQEKIDSETDKDEIEAQTSFLSNNEQTKKSRRKQKMALRKDF